MDSQIKLKGCPFDLFYVMWTSQRILAARKSALAILQIVLFFIYFISFANRQGHRNSLRQLLRARN